MDLNSDLGEGFGQWTLGDDDALLGVVTSANVACGFHAGDASIMRRVCAKAVASGVAIGAAAAKHGLGFSIAVDALFFALGAILIWLLPETKGTEL